LLEVASGKEIQRFFTGSDAVYAVAFSPDERTVYAVGMPMDVPDELLMAWDVATGSELQRFEVTQSEINGGNPIHTGPTDVRVSLAPAAQRALGIFDAQLVLWNLETGTEIRRIETSAIHAGWINGITISPDGQWGLSASDDRTLVLWNLETGKPAKIFRGHESAVLGAIFTPDALQAVSYSIDSTSRLWDLTAGNEISHLQLTDFNQMNAMAISPDGKKALLGVSNVGTAPYAVIEIDLETNTEIRRIGSGYEGIINSLAYSPDGRNAVLASSGTLIVRDLVNDQEIYRRTDTPGAALVMVYSPDGSKIAVGGGGMSLMFVLDAASGEWLYSDTVTATGELAFTPDSSALIFTTFEGEIAIFDARTGQRTLSLTGHQAATYGVAVSPDGQQILSAGLDQFMILWDRTSGNEIRRFQLPTRGRITTVAISPDGQLALSGSDDGQTILWDMNTGEILARFEGHTATVASVRFNRDGQTAYSVSTDGSFRQWKLPPRSAQEWLAWTAANRYVRNLSPDEMYRYGLTDKPAAAISLSLPATPAPSVLADEPVMPVIPMPSHQQTASQGENRGQLTSGSPQVWGFEGQQGTLVAIYAAAYQPASLDTCLTVWSPDGNVLAQNDDFKGSADTNARTDVSLPVDGTYTIAVCGVEGRDQGQYTLDIEPIALGTELYRQTYADRGVWSVTLSPDGRYALSSLGPKDSMYNVYNTGTLSLWDLAEPAHPQEMRRFNENYQLHAMSVASLSFCPDVHSMLSASWDATLLLTNVDTAEKTFQMEGHWNAIWHLDCLRSLGMGISSGWDGEMILWDLKTGQAVRHFRHGARVSSSVWSVAVGANDTRAISASVDGRAIVWDIATGEKLREFNQHHTGLMSAALSSDGHTAATGDISGGIVIWDINTGQIIHRLTGHRDGDWVSDLNFTADGRFLLSAAFDGTVRLWDVATGREVVRFVGHTAHVWSAVISPDNRTVVSGSLDGTMRIWAVPDLPAISGE
jgi:WD40 repeat protein